MKYGNFDEKIVGALFWIIFLWFHLFLESNIVFKIRQLLQWKLIKINIYVLIWNLNWKFEIMQTLDADIALINSRILIELNISQRAVVTVGAFSTVGAVRNWNR